MDFNLIVIGAGPAGYVAAIRASQLGMTVCLVEANKSLGGTCLNVGCIPSKALLDSSEKFAEAVHGLGDHGIAIAKPTLNLKKMLARKDGVVNQLTGGISYLMKKNKVTVKHGWAKITDPNTVSIDSKGNENSNVTADKILIATGSTPIELPFAKYDHKIICDSTDALNFSAVPKHLVVIGAGVIGLELGSVWQRLGAKVTLVDIADRPLVAMDKELGTTAQKTFEKQGLNFKLGAGVKNVKTTKTGATLTIEKDGKPETIKADKVLVAVGRMANTGDIGLQDLGVETTDRGVININQNFQTNIPSIYAVGDCVPGPMLAHKGEEEGIACVEKMAGQAGHVNYNVIPGVVYTHPEFASVGLTEAECKDKNLNINVGKFPFAANGRALATGQGDGFVKIIADKQTDEVLGVHIMGNNASELIAEAVIAMEFSASAEDIARTCHAHPTLSEATKEAALAVAKRAIHS